MRASAALLIVAVLGCGRVESTDVADGAGDGGTDGRADGTGDVDADAGKVWGHGECPPAPVGDWKERCSVDAYCVYVHGCGSGTPTFIAYACISGYLKTNETGYGCPDGGIEVR